MTLRVSTSGLHGQALQGLLKRQMEVARTQQQMISGSKIQRAADDPTGAAQGQRIDGALAALEQFGKSGDTLQRRLGMQEQALSDIGDKMTRARELAVQANSGAMSAGDKQVIATELRQLRADMLSVANRDDGNGRFLFAGRRDGVAPFADNGGTVAYYGDDGRNLVDVAPDLALADTDPGSELFVRVRSGNGEIRATPAATNAGNLVVQSTAVTTPSAWPGTPLRLQFTAPDAYQVVDGAGTVLASGAYAPGDTINAAGVQTRLIGTPATGDAISLDPAPTQDIFTSLRLLADALEAPSGTQAEKAAQANALGNAIGDIGNAQEHLLNARASTGARLSSLDQATSTREAQNLALHTELSGLRDVDYAEAASRLSMQMAAIDAAQRTMLRVQSLSLFDKI